MPNQDLAPDIRKLIDRGLLVEAGWYALHTVVFLEGVPADQLKEMRLIFFAGAHHLFSCIMEMLDPDDNGPTQDDLVRMGKINDELTKFLDEFQKEHNLT